MHFWIDKRSQACGFGRARVSASLSGAGPGVGLGFGHPPRRIGGNKAFTSLPTMHRQQHHHHQVVHHQHHQTTQQQQQRTPLQQQQQHHHHHQQQQQQHIHQPSATFSNSSSIIRSAANCHVRGCNQFGAINNNTAITAVAASNNFNNSSICQQQHAQQQQQQQQQQLNLQRPTTQLQYHHQASTYSINNNAHLQQQQQQQLQRKQQQQPPRIDLSYPPNAITVAGNCNALNNNNSGNGNHNNNNNNTSNISNSTQLPSVNSSIYMSASASSSSSSATASAVATATATATASAAVFTGTSGAIVPTATTNISGRYNRHHHHHHHHQHQQLPRISASVVPEMSQSATGGGHHHYDTRSYYHPQFGNMSVRHYQCNDNSAGHTNTRIATSPRSASPRIADNHSQASAVTSHGGYVTPTVTVAATATTAATMHECRNGSSRTGGILQQHLNSPLPHVCGGLTNAENVEGAGNLTLGPIHTRTLHNHQHASTTVHQQRSMPNGNMRAALTHNGTTTAESTETQPILSQLKCGMWASLVLASVFVAGTKFYLDNQGTGLEVIIFCTFSATFFLAACTVSLCRLPKGLVRARHLSVNSRGLLPSTVQGVRASGSADAAGTANHRNLFGQSNQQRLHDLQEHTAATLAGPPPYHIAILLPEHRKDAVTDESPPPSYDKILK